MTASKDWTFTQLGPPYKKLILSGWSAPFGRPRHEPVVTETLAIRQKTTYYPGTDTPPTRHVFGDKYEPWELKGRWMDSVGGKDYAKEQAAYVRAFVRDKQPVAIAWGDITGAEGFIDKLEIGRESEQHVTWKLSILIDADTSTVQAQTANYLASPPSKSLQALRAALQKVAKPLPTTPPVIKLSVLDALDNMVGSFNSAIASVLGVVGQIESFEKAALGDIRRLRGGLHQLRTAALTLRNTVSSLAQSSEMFTSRSAAAELHFGTYFTKTDVDMTRALGAAAEMDRQAAVAERGRAGTTHRAQRGDTWESLAARYLGSPDKAQDLRDMNGAKFGEQPTPGTAIRVPLR